MPKYDIDDIVVFNAPDKIFPQKGVIWKRNVYENPHVVVYDIYVEKKNIVYKHIEEKWIKMIIGVNREPIWFIKPKLIDDYRE